MKFFTEILFFFVLAVVIGICGIAASFFWGALPLLPVLIFFLLLCGVTAFFAVRFLKVYKKAREFSNFFSDENNRDNGDVSVLPADVRDFILEYRDLKNKTRKAAERGKSNGAELAQTIQDSSVSITIVTESVGSIQKEVINLEQRVLSVKSELEQMVAGISLLNQKLTNQLLMVEESTASVTQMLSSLENMNRLVVLDQKLVEELVNSLDEGRDIFSGIFDRIGTISQNVSRINEMAEVIDAVSSQTNLLAMNAAIEAAHAGDAGLGFAVVAEEVRKLAEDSAESSRGIGDNISSIVTVIGAAASESNTMNESFTRIEANMSHVARSISEFFGSISESNIGGKQILSSMFELKNTSSAITETSRRMNAGTDSISRVMIELDMVSTRISDSMDAIAFMLDGVQGTFGNIQDLALQFKSFVSDLIAPDTEKKENENSAGSVTVPHTETVNSVMLSGGSLHDANSSISAKAKTAETAHPAAFTDMMSTEIPVDAFIKNNPEKPGRDSLDDEFGGSPNSSGISSRKGGADIGEFEEILAEDFLK